MSGSAWLMLIGTWSITTFFTVRLFLKVLRKRPPADSCRPSE